MLSWAHLRRHVAGLPPWLQGLLFGAGVFVVFACTAWYGPRQNTDTWAATLSAWQLGQHGTLDLANYGDKFPWRTEVGPHVYTNRFVGVILAGAPFYALLGDPAEPTIFPGAIAAAFWAALSATFALVVARSIAPPRLAVAAALVFAFATPVWSVSADALWPHGPNQAFLLGCLAVLSSRRASLAGVAAAATILIRPHMAVAWGALCTYGWSKDRGRRRRWVLLGLLAGAGVVAISTYNLVMFGAFGVLGGYDGSHLRAQGVGPLVLVVNIMGSLISPHRGILLLTPFLWLLLPGLRQAWREAPVWVRSSAVGGLAYAAVQLYLLRFIGGHGFYSYRTMLEPLTFAFPLLVLAYRAWARRTAPRRTAFALLVLFSVSFHAFGAILDPHAVETGNPFRVVAGAAVARSVGAGATAAWVLATALIGVVVFRSVRRREGAYVGRDHLPSSADSSPAAAAQSQWDGR